MEKATSERLANLRVQLSFCNGTEGDLRSRIEAEIRDILAGKETRQGERERPEVEVRDEDWMADARRRVERIF